MSARIRLTPAQRRALALLAIGGTEARPTRGIRWEVTDRLGRHVGTAHAATLACLHDRELIEFSGLAVRITDAGRQWWAGGTRDR